MLFYRQEQLGNMGERPKYEIKVEAFTEATSDKDFELIFNKA
jgi:hypothetical protein